MEDVRKPIIGIVSRPQVTRNDVRVDIVNDKARRAIIKNGGIPIAILPMQDVTYSDTRSEHMLRLSEEEKDDIIKQIKLCDGVLLQGGSRWFEYDEFIAEYLLKNDIPSLFICMSMQLLCTLDINEGNSRIINKELIESNNHINTTHDITIDKNSILYKIIGKDNIEVNSFHKYTVKRVNKLKIVSKADDIIEAVEYPNKRFIMGLQWHPEKMIDYDDDSNKIIKYFINSTLR